MSLKNVYEGWKNVVITDEQVEQMAKERIEICNQCPERMKSINVCGLCHCPLIAKTRSPQEQCPQGKWKVITKDDNTKKDK